MKYKGEWELYDLDADRTELHNLAATYTDITKKMAAQWDAWAAITGVRRSDARACKPLAADRRDSVSDKPRPFGLASNRLSCGEP